jgi:hypothetical protein
MPGDGLRCLGEFAWWFLQWFPEQSVDPSLEERVTVWRRGYRGRTCRMAGSPVIAVGLGGNHDESEHGSVTLESSFV